jgi:hypothetical protein
MCHSASDVLKITSPQSETLLSHNAEFTNQASLKKSALIHFVIWPSIGPSDHSQNHVATVKENNQVGTQQMRAAALRSGCSRPLKSQLRLPVKKRGAD